MSSPYRERLPSFNYIPCCKSVAIKSFTFQPFLAKLQFLDGEHELHLLLNPLTFKFFAPPCDRWKKKFIVPIKTTYFIIYVFRLYTKSTSVLDIRSYLVCETRPFPNHFSFSIHEQIALIELLSKLHWTDLHIHCINWELTQSSLRYMYIDHAKMLLKARYWPSCIHIWTPLVKMKQCFNKTII
jgi:hypothetical protein